METLFDPTEHDYRYIIGVDLGTTNSAVAYVDLADDKNSAPALEESLEQRTIHFFDVPQLVAAGEFGKRPVLPSFLYLPGEYDLAEGSTALPWDDERAYAVGEFAREQGARVPGRLVASAKSWLSHAGVDRTGAILPWGAEEGVPQVSPVEASRRYLLHIREAWNGQMATIPDDEDSLEEPIGLFEEQLVILTVPASFDEVARELTLQAAHDAGIPKVILLEEPLAAFYAWLSEHEATWQQQMRDQQLILVCDVGGGTTDFSIVGIREGAGGMRFDRLAVGEHLLLGGDNMDLTLGRYIETKLMGQPGKLDPQRWSQLVHHCRQAKETLLDARDLDASVDISIVGSAAKLIAGTLKSTLTRAEVHKLLLDGFFPQIASDELPADAKRSALTELGLPYVQDAAITRHLAGFWQRFSAFLEKETGRDTPTPDYVLFNGGTLIPRSIRKRILDVVADWFAPTAGADWRPVELSNPRPDLSVAMGAGYFGLVRLGRGVRVGSGSPRAFYVGVSEAGGEGENGTQSSQRMHRGHRGKAEGEFEVGQVAGQERAVCLVPRGTEEGFEVQLGAPEFEALTNRPVAFRLFTSSTRVGDGLGDIVRLTPDEVSELPPIQTVLRYGRRGEATSLPIQLAVRLTEIGTLELWCQSQQTEHRWQLQFDVRHAAGADYAPDEDRTERVIETVDQALVADALALIRTTFEAGGPPPARLRSALEETLGLPKEAWPTPLIRQLADALLEAEAGRAISAEHEARWLNLLGYCLRPGFGHPVDEWRMKHVWKLHFEGLRHARQAQNRSEWWVFWRRVAGGLKGGQQMEIYHQVRPYVASGAGKGRGKRKPTPMFPARLSAGEELEIWLALANLEWLTGEIKTTLGRRLIERFGKVPAQGRSPKSQEIWSLSRFGARTAIYGPLDRLCSAGEVEKWIDQLLKHNPEPNSSLAHALILMARLTGDRARDVSTETRALVAVWLGQMPNGEHFLELLTNPESVQQQEEQDWVFGEALPVGLVLRG